MRRRGVAMVLVLSLAVLLLATVGALFQQGQDAVAQAARVEGRLALEGLLSNAAAEAWWTALNPGRTPDVEPVEFFRKLRTRAAAEFSPALKLVTGERACRLPAGGVLKVVEVSVRARDVRAAGVPQGTLELRAIGEFRGDRVAMRVALVELRPYWLTGPAAAARLQYDDAPISRAVEELP